MKAWILAAAANAALAPSAFAVEEKPCRAEVLERAAAAEAASPPPAACPNAASRENAGSQAQSREARRRNGSRIPDAELIGPRLVL